VRAFRLTAWRRSTWQRNRNDAGSDNALWFAEPYEKKGHVRLNRDTVGGSVKNLLPKMKESLADGKSCILDNTHVTVKARADFIKAAQDLGIPIHAKWVSTAAEDCQFNACTRMMHREGRILSPAELKDHKSPNMFPPGVIFMFRKQFEQPRPSEGFASVEEIKYVRRPYPKQYKNKAIILDYDGTLRRSTGEFNWPTTPDEVELLPGRTKVLKKWQSDGYLLLGVSNQSPVAKGQFTEGECQEMFDHTNALLGLDIEVMFCPHKVPPIGCYCRKPGTGIAVYFIEKYKLCPDKCICVGDQTSDRTFAKRARFKYQDASVFFNG